MTVLTLIAITVVYVAVLATLFIRHRPTSSRHPAPGAERILFPFLAGALSERTLDSALRLARAEGAVLVPVVLARVPLHLPLDAPLPGQAGIAMPLLDAVEQRADAFEVAVDARIARGRSTRDALRQAITDERFDRIVMAAAVHGVHGFGPEDIAWTLEHAPGEIVVLRPGTDEPVIRVPDPRRRTGPRRRRSVDPVARRPGHGILSGGGAFSREA